MNFIYFSLGMVCLQMVYVLTHYILFRHKEFLYFLFFSISMIGLCLFKIFPEMNPLGHLQGEETFSSIYGFIFIALAMYTMFLRIFLDLKLLYPKINKSMLIFEKVLITSSLLILVLNLFSYQVYTKKIFLSLYVLSIPFILFLIVYLGTRKRTINRIIMAGTMGIFVMGRIIVLFHFFVLKRNPDVNSYNFLMGSILILFLFLNIAMLYKSKLTHLHNLELELQRQAELSNQRQMISANLHDDLGATLSSIKINATMAQNFLTDNLPKADKLLKRITSDLKVVIDNLGDIIWAINPGHSNQKSMSSQVKDFYFDLMDGYNIECNYFIDKELENQITNISARKNLLLITKEAINNILKHAQSTKVEISMKDFNGQLLLEIQDNGVGLAESDQQLFGNGLRNMKLRAESMEGELTITSAPGMGTTIACKVPYTNIRYAG